MSRYAIGLFCAFLLLIFALPLAAQYTDRTAFQDLGGPEEFARRRHVLAQEAKSGYIILFARNALPESAHYREDNDFFYFTGLQDPGAVLLMDLEKDETTIFEPQMAPRTAQVYGPNLLAMPEAGQKQIGAMKVLPLNLLDPMLSRFVGSGKEVDLWTRLGFPDKADGARAETGFDNSMQYNHPYGTTTPANLQDVQKLRERYPMAHLRDLTAFIDAMRNIKTPQEIAILRRNGKLSAAGHLRAISHARPGMWQYQIETEAEYVFHQGGAEGDAYPAIVGSGENVNTWHYFSNRNRIEPNQIVVFDFAADLDHETMDITRTFNISGKFTPEQAKWYDVDLAAQKACIALLAPGHTYEEAAAAGKKIFDDAGVGAQWHGFPGHFVGLATHDVLRPTGPVKPGQVVTVEPIVEFPDKRMHFRVEDTVLVTSGAPEVLSADVPKERADIEKLVGSAAGK
jgi:Xaa-Pro aminopeptidase